MKRRHATISGEAPNSCNPEPSDLTSAKVSKRVKACTACQTRKIRCELPDDKSSCLRCRRLSLRCQVQKDLQSLLEDDVHWKTAQNAKSQRLEMAVALILSKLDLPALDTIERGDLRVPQSEDSECNDLERVALSPRSLNGMTRDNSQEPESFDGNAVAAPMSSLLQVTKHRKTHSSSHKHTRSNRKNGADQDLISRGTLSLATAAELFHYFRQSLNHYLWAGIALVHTTMEQVRESSTLLTTAIMTASALHLPGYESVFDICYNDLLDLISSTIFVRRQTLDDIRGLCIGAFWLSEVSWKLSGHAVRIGMEMQLHLSPAKALKGSSEHLERARLWYLLYVCDHHFSIAYGRPPIVQEDSAISSHEAFLSLDKVNQSDYRIHSQVGVFRILSRMQRIFGMDDEEALTEDDLARVRQYNLDLDMWRIKWENLLSMLTKGHPFQMLTTEGPNDYIANYPAKGVVLHYHFAKLQLNALALRGLDHYSNLSPNRREFINLAVVSAMNALNTIIHETEIRSSVIGVPLYLHTTITCSIVFLVQAHVKWGHVVSSKDPTLVKQLILEIIRILSTSPTSERHLSSHMARGLRNLLNKFEVWSSSPQNQPITVNYTSSLLEQPTTSPRTECPLAAHDIFAEDNMFDFDGFYLPIDFFDNLTAQISA